MTITLPLTDGEPTLESPVTGEEQAEQVVRETFGTEDNAYGTAEVMSHFTNSYEKHKTDKELDQWLTDEFRKYPGTWQDAGEAKTTARMIIDANQAANKAKVSLHEHLGMGKSRESWLAKRIEQGATSAGIVEVGAYAATVDNAVTTATQRMEAAILTKDGLVSQLRNLDGFIAEQHHVNTFNLDATARGSLYRARVLAPEPGQPYGENSLDIGIYDPAGKLVRRYQSKYGADAGATKKLLGAGDYRGQRKLVPSEQVGQVEGSTSVIEFDGNTSKPLSKADAKALQQEAQARQEAKAYTWNDVNRIEIARTIGKQALFAAALAAAFQGARIVGRRTWNNLSGKENPPVCADITEFFESSLNSAVHAGIQVAITGAIMIAAKNGWLGSGLRGTPAGQIAAMVYVGVENAKVIYKFAKGKISGEEALDAMGNVTFSAVGGIIGATKGMAVGASIGALLGPLGAAVGGFVGAVVGGMAGSKIGEAVWEGQKAIQKTSVKVLKTLYEGARETAEAMGRILIPAIWFA
jgi:hypothetical protein